MLLQIGGRRPGGEIAMPEPTLFDRHVVGRIELANPTTLADINTLLDELPPT